jgi:hypothetical protein
VATSWVQPLVSAAVNLRSFVGTTSVVCATHPSYRGGRCDRSQHMLVQHACAHIEYAQLACNIVTSTHHARSSIQVLAVGGARRACSCASQCCAPWGVHRLLFTAADHSLWRSVLDHDGRGRTARGFCRTIQGQDVGCPRPPLTPTLALFLRVAHVADQGVADGGPMYELASLGRGDCAFL